jgi:hypothetical protein
MTSRRRLPYASGAMGGNRSDFKALRLLGFAVLLAVLLSACAGSGDKGTDSAKIGEASGERIRQAATTLDDLVGTWTGDWRTMAGGDEAGTVRIEWRRAGRVMRGFLQLSGASCLSRSEITAVVNGPQVDFEALAPPEKVTYTGTIAGDTIDGSYSMTCGDATGMWKVKKI